MRKSHLKKVAELLNNELNNLGLPPGRIVNSKTKHGKFYFTVSGREWVVPISLTPSDWRAQYNKVSQLRNRVREIRENGR